MSRTFQHVLSVWYVHGAAAGHFERQKGCTHWQCCGELVESCGTVHCQYTQAWLRGHFHIQKNAHQMKNVDRFLPSIFCSRCRHADCQMSVCWELVVSWFPWWSWLLTQADVVLMTWWVSCSRQVQVVYQWHNWCTDCRSVQSIDLQSTRSGWREALRISSLG